MQLDEFNLGEKVSVIDNAITGVIIEISQREIKLKDENGFVYTYLHNEVVKVFNFNESFVENHKSFIKEINTTTRKKEKKSQIQEILEVDLHIHQITKSNKYLSNFDMLNRQINFANQKIKFAIKNNIQRVVFIHGIGQGVLKSELYKVFKKYKVEINDANYQKYGQGATEIYIYKN